VTNSRRKVTGFSPIYCNKCCVRVGIGERHLIKQGRPYHVECYTKAEDKRAGK
jgi:hypothetical protein